MGIFDSLLGPLDKLITEHGSAAVLREHLGLLKTKLADAEREHRDLQAKYEASQAKVQHVEQQVAAYKAELDAIKRGRFDGPACDACGSFRLRRTGNRPDPVPAFARAGGRQAVFTCEDCGAVSGFGLRE